MNSFARCADHAQSVTVAAEQKTGSAKTPTRLTGRPFVLVLASCALVLVQIRFVFVTL